MGMAVQFVRSARGKIVAGICAGLGVYFNIDTTLVRILTAVLIVATGGTVLLAYLIMWMLIPLGEPVHKDANWTTA